jgi:Mg2+-importing ATPase
VFGLLSCGFDLLTFALLLQVFDAGATLFHTGWFLGSVLTELAVLFVLRTRRPAFRSPPGKALVGSSLAVGVVTVALPFVPGVAHAMGFTRPPAVLLGALVVIVASYVAAAELTKRVYYRDAGVAGSPPPAPRTPHARRLESALWEHGHRRPR